ncbi:MAG: ABC transporter permease, partial [Clostridium sp.]
MRHLQKIWKNKTLYGIIIVIIFWYILHFSIDSNMIPSPHETFKVFFELMQKDLVVHLLFSTYRITIALSISILIGVPLGLWTGINKTLDAIISPVVYILYPLPKIAFLPVFMVLFGLGDTS